MSLNGNTRSQLAYRVAVPSEAPYLAALINTAFRSELPGQTWLFDDQERRIDIVSTEPIAGFIDSAESVLLTGVINNGSAAVVCCYLRKPSNPPEPHITADAAWFDLLSVLSAHHGCGYGFAMLAAAENFVLEHWSAKRLEFDFVSSRLQLRAWYERCGYRATGARRDFPYGQHGREILADGLDMVVLGKDLEDQQRNRS
ncbi:hypothetical protein CLAFUW4_10343 [Fulvia fulva]|nr:hypothetical protein CLAFUR4_10347 [Fulvia fulva]WPV18972.1 hypothetical protein CLAFUW4_10343 [Fulvia fulva]WPV33943.1 hypothetical protein CLAFUW7_10343 [Fulvia fulva]